MLRALNHPRGGEREEKEGGGGRREGLWLISCIVILELHTNTRVNNVWEILAWRIS
jgi:hypothetical protein